MPEMITGMPNDQPVTLQRGEQGIVVDSFPVLRKKGGLRLILGKPQPDRLLLEYPFWQQLQLSLFVFVVGLIFLFFSVLPYWASMVLLGGSLLEGRPAFFTWVDGVALISGTSGIIVLIGIILLRRFGKSGDHGCLCVLLICLFLFLISFLFGVVYVAFVQERPFLSSWSWIEIMIGVLLGGLAVFLLMIGLALCFGSLMPYKVCFDRRCGLMRIILTGDPEPEFRFNEIVAVQVLRAKSNNTTRLWNLGHRSSAIVTDFEVNLVLDLPIKRWNVSVSSIGSTARQLGREIADFLQVPLVEQISA